jgi:hypothetical protein
MKKIKALFCAILLSTCLAGNVFAGGTTSSGSFFSFFTEAMNAVVSFFRGDNCPPRQCQTCRPPNEGGDDNDPNCRPRDN